MWPATNAIIHELSPRSFDLKLIDQGPDVSVLDQGPIVKRKPLSWLYFQEHQCTDRCESLVGEACFDADHAAFVQRANRTTSQEGGQSRMHAIGYAVQEV